MRFTRGPRQSGPCFVAFIVVGMVAAVCAAQADTTGSPISWTVHADVYAPVKEWVKTIEQKNADGAKNKIATYSKVPRKVDEATWLVAVHVNTAEAGRQVTERYDLTVRRTAEGKAWSVAEAKVVDTYVGMFRDTETRCSPFEKFSFRREGLELSAQSGEVCERVTEGEVLGFVVHGSSMTYAYAPPAHAALVPTGHDFYAVHKVMARDHSSELAFQPSAFHVRCDVQTCAELLGSTLTRNPSGQASAVGPLPQWAEPQA